MKKYGLYLLIVGLCTYAVADTKINSNPKIDAHALDSPSKIIEISNAASKCVQVNSTGRSSCNDAGNFPSTCAVATCPAGYTLTGGGGVCAAGDRKIKALNPQLDKGQFHIMCEEQGVDPQARAICCKF